MADKTSSIGLRLGLAIALVFGLIASSQNISAASEPAWWAALKVRCGLPASTAYNDWVAHNMPCQVPVTATTVNQSTDDAASRARRAEEAAEKIQLRLQQEAIAKGVIPAIPEIPSALPVELRLSLDERRTALIGRRATVSADQTNAQSQCSAVEQNQTRYQSCMGLVAEQLSGEIQNLDVDIGQFSTDITAATDATVLKSQPLLSAQLTSAQRQALESVLGDLQQQVSVVQNAVRGLSGSMKLDPEQRVQWEGTISHAECDAAHRGIDLSVDVFFYRAGESYDNQLAAIDQDISAKADFSPQMRLLVQQRRQITRGQTLLNTANRLDAIRTLSAADPCRDNPVGVESKLDKAYEVGATKLGDPIFKEIVETSWTLRRQIPALPDIINGAKYGKSILDSAYDITAESLSWRQLAKLNEHSEQFAKQSKLYQQRLNTLEARIREIKAALANIQT